MMLNNGFGIFDIGFTSKFLAVKPGWDYGISA
jgi:hypothetical protein